MRGAGVPDIGEARACAARVPLARGSMRPIRTQERLAPRAVAVTLAALSIVCAAAPAAHARQIRRLPPGIAHWGPGVLAPDASLLVAINRTAGSSSAPHPVRPHDRSPRDAYSAGGRDARTSDKGAVL